MERDFTPGVCTYTRPVREAVVARVCVTATIRQWRGISCQVYIHPLSGGSFLSDGDHLDRRHLRDSRYTSADVVVLAMSEKIPTLTSTLR